MITADADRGIPVGVLTGRTALITGAAHGIGEAIALAYADAGAWLVLLDRDAGARLDSVRDACTALGVEAVSIAADVSDQGQLERAYAEGRAALGAIDVVVNNAGILSEHTVTGMPTELWDEMIAVNLRSVFLSCRIALPSMLEGGFGRIINISSQLGQRGGPGFAHYAAAKAGVIGFTKSLARELGDSGVTANCIAPGPIDTGIGGGSLSPEWSRSLMAGLPMKRSGHAREVAPTAVLLASEPGGNIYTGQTLTPNSGDVMQ
ncbi:3-oxoacyl-ACP reductase [Microlunatus endophyticus]|uniref:3-oxoacyl-ACP reductase n=1 Tax=Microlunatus endophyticus TaxID=1716077 RepID=A0A917W1N5_9ACTN|nr:SDR family oxidoreductase [Microlunatus endophyticus]GGL57052.1 3-oxoacyl-ACP reductase [Microlunatus endophyticus]